MLLSQHLAAPQHTITLFASAAAVGAAAAAAKVPAGLFARILWGPPCCSNAAWGCIQRMLVDVKFLCVYWRRGRPATQQRLYRYGVFRCAHTVPCS